MKPLLFLTYRSLINGLRRALTSPKRLLSLVFVVGYYFMFIIRPWIASKQTLGVPAQFAGKLDFPPLTAIDAALFTLFSLFSILFLIGTGTYKGTFRPADVDILFPTPISPKTVLLFRLIREYLVTLIIPFVFVLLLYGPVSMGWQMLFRNVPHPETSGLVFKMMSLSWFLVAMCWIAINYAAGMFVNRSDRQSDWNKRILTWGVAVCFVSICIYAYFIFRDVTSLKQAIAALQSPVLRVVFFIASAATSLTMAPITGNVVQGIAGAALLLSVILVSLKLTLSQAGWLYDQAAVRGFSQLESVMKRTQGDIHGLAALRARNGKKRTYKAKALHRVRVQGAWALLWKDCFIQYRSFGLIAVVLMLPGLAISVMPVLIDSGTGGVITPLLFIGCQVFSILMSTINTSISGFMETLRSGDILRPMPFQPLVVITLDSISKSIWGIIGNVIGGVIVFILKPAWWLYILSSVLIVTPAFSVLISATVLLVTLLFPDGDDNAQRQFHRIVMLLATIVISAPGLGVLALLMLVPFLRAIPIIPAAIGSLVFAMMAAGVNVISSNLYASYNPSE
jgi:hypothetical protein